MPSQNLLKYATLQNKKKEKIRIFKGQSSQVNAARAHRSGAVMGISVGTSLDFPQSGRAQM